MSDQSGRVFTPVVHRKPPLHPHPWEPSGEFLGFGNRLERCGLCDLVQRDTRWHPVIAPASTPSPANEEQTP